MKLDEQLIGRTVDGILITDFIGAGGMGEAFRGVQKDLKREVCIKFMKQEYLSDKESIYRFRREARALARLRHKNIISCYSVGVLDKVSPYIVTEFITGKSLRQVLDDGPLELRRALRVVKELCDALNFIHNHGLIHRDVKPENIMLTSLDEHETVKLLDFGLVGKTFTNNFEGTLTDPSALIGTANYMPPEAFMGKGAERGQDVYAVGCVLHELLTGDIPFSADTPIAVMHRHFNDPLPSLPSTIKPPVLRSVLDAIVEKSTAVDPTERFESCAEISELLTLLLEKPDADHTGALLVNAHKPSRPARGAVFSQRMRLAIGLLAGALVILTAFAIVKTQTTSMSEQKAHQADAYDISSLKALSSSYRKLCTTWSTKDSLTFEQTNQALIETKRCIEMTSDLTKKNSPASLLLVTPAGSAEVRSIAASMGEIAEKAGRLVPSDLIRQKQSKLLASFGYFFPALCILKQEKVLLQFRDVRRYNAEDLHALHDFVLSKTGPATDRELACLRIIAPYYFLIRPQPELFRQFLRRLNERELTDDLVPGLVEISQLNKSFRRSESERVLIDLVEIEARSKKTAKAAEVLREYLKLYPQPNALDGTEIKIGFLLAENMSFEAGMQWLGAISRHALRKQNYTAYCDTEITKAKVLLHHSGKNSARESLHKLISSSEFKRVLFCSDPDVTLEASANVVLPLVRVLSETGDFKTCVQLMAQVTKTERSRAEDMPECSDPAVGMRAAEDLYVESLWNNGEKDAARREIRTIIARRHPSGDTMVSDRELWPLRVSSRTLLKNSKESDAQKKQVEDTSLSRRLYWSIWFRDRNQVNDTIALCNESLKVAPQDFLEKGLMSTDWEVLAKVTDSALQRAVGEHERIDPALLASLMHNVSVQVQRMLAADRVWQLKDFELFDAWLELLRFAPSRNGTHGQNAVGITEELLTRCKKDQYLGRFLLLQKLIPPQSDSTDLSIIRRVHGEYAAAKECLETVLQEPSLVQFRVPLLQKWTLITSSLHYMDDAKQSQSQLANELLLQDRRTEAAHAWVRAGECANAYGELFEAMTTLERADALVFEGRDFDGFIKLKLAWIYAKAGQTEKLGPLLNYLVDDARVRHPEVVDELKRTSESIYALAYSLDNNAESIRHIDLLLASTQKEPSLRLGAYVTLANQLMQSRDYDKALAVTTRDLRPVLLQVIKVPDGESYDYYRELLGSIYQRLDRPRDAEVELKASLNGRNTLWPRNRRLRRLADAQIDGGKLTEARANICLAKETLESLYGESDSSTKHVDIPNTAIVFAVYSRLLRAENKNTEADLFAGKAIDLLKSESAKAVREEASYVVRKLAKDFALGTPMRQEFEGIVEELGRPYTIKPNKIL